MGSKNRRFRGVGRVRRNESAWAGKSTRLRLESLESRWLLSNVPFSEIDITSAALNALSVYAADVDSDGDMDVLSASVGDVSWPEDRFHCLVGIPGEGPSGDDSIAWYENDGGGNFRAHTITTDVKGADSVYAADVDSDGDVDVLSASCVDDKIAWYENDGSQNFTTHTITTAAHGAYCVYAADMDSDGDMDVLSASARDDTIAWYENGGHQNFVSVHRISTFAEYARSVYATDVDADGDMDLLAGTERSINWYENDGGQYFTLHKIPIFMDTHPVFADVDSDGDLDILATDGPMGEAACWYENDGRQNFTVHGIATYVGVEYEAVYAADVDSDGDMDVLSVSRCTSILNGDKTLWYENDGRQHFTAHTIAVSRASSVYAADVDSDGDLDVLSAGANGVVWYESNAAKNFPSHGIATIAKGTCSAYAADVDADGGLDVLAASAGNHRIDWYKDDGRPHFADYTIAATATGACSVYAADVDSDGDLDVLSASSGDNTIAWRENDGRQNFTARTITTSADYAWSVYAADVDSDGDLDVLSASVLDNKIAWYENDGGRNFTAHTITAAAMGACSVYAADMDSDGDMDVLSASSGNSTIAWFRNDVCPVAAPGGPYLIDEGQGLTLDASASTPAIPRRALVSYEWDLDNDGLYDDCIGSSPVVSVSWATLAALNLSSDGVSHTVGLRVTDNTAAIATATTTLVIRNLSPAALGAGGPYTINEGAAFTPTPLAATDPGGDPLVYAWDLDNNGSRETAGLTPVIFWATLAGLGLASNGSALTIELWASDGQGGTSVASTTLTIDNAPPSAPGAGGPYAIAEGTSLSLAGTAASDPGGDTLTYAWYLDNNGSFETAGLSSTVPWARLAELGLPSNGATLTINLRASDGQGGTSTSASTLAIGNLAPTTPGTGGPYRIDKGTSLALTGSAATDPGGDPLVYAWDLDNNGSFETAGLTPTVPWATLAGLRLGQRREHFDHQASGERRPGGNQHRDHHTEHRQPPARPSGLRRPVHDRRRSIRDIGRHSSDRSGR
jgi:hypothetical protein